MKMKKLLNKIRVNEWSVFGLVALVAVGVLLSSFSPQITGSTIQDIMLYKCQETDDGKDSHVRGTTVAFNLQGTDACMDWTGHETATCKGRYCYLKEYYCVDGKQAAWMRKPCPADAFVCAAGACVTPEKVDQTKVDEFESEAGPEQRRWEMPN